ncbi:acetyl-CoA carboxylase biotin carboxyl carrier protein [Termitidicoccus mucosus]|uniref:Biotin carboxyl carrier protein of acetyl-CoA carboxylase n=1 Tax=Termitidicoccus mucosus TaxID=1184151 RepID=A0A178IBQ6_9BACT|nr:acetyl-CoA carboxylase biotin carboxyl carrier protein subunit [Opitutaceae bacterium TSB47]
MDIKQIKQIIELIKTSELTEFALEEEGFKLKIRRGEGGAVIGSAPGGTYPPIPLAASAAPAAAPVASVPAAPSAGGAATVAASADEPGVSYIKSPMVGTFYRAPSPESVAFVEPGAAVAENTVVCIIEAMKIMNEIQAETKGVVVEALVESGQPVEYGQRLFKIKQA